MSNCPKPDPCDLQKFTVSASSSYPPSSVDWKVELPMEEHMYYQNVTYDLIAVLICRIGIEFSKVSMSGSTEGLDQTINALRLAIKGDENIPEVD